MRERIFMATHQLIPKFKTTLPYTFVVYFPKIFRAANKIHSFSLFKRKNLSFTHSSQIRVHTHSSSQNPIKAYCLETLILCIFSLTLLSLRLVSNVVSPDFPQRWNQLIAFSEEAEAKFTHYPSCLWQAVIAYEDRRFFTHLGVDPIGISRAVLSFSALGGGSTITQQLVKNIFLKNECTFLRKAVEMVLAIALERTISKLRILSSYLSKIYWGHGIYGIESASGFYFGKHPSILSLGECALLVGIIPAPELRSPFRDSCRGKVFQARVLKRMVEVGFLDIDAALLVFNQCSDLQSTWSDYADGIFLAASSPKELGTSVTQRAGICSTMKIVWDWERESKIWEVREDLETWAMNMKEIKQRRKKIGRL